jgi:hypothetical protein
MKTLWRKIGLFICSLDWHRRPFEKEPRPRGVTPEQHQFHSRYYCTRCGLVGQGDCTVTHAPNSTLCR